METTTTTTTMNIIINTIAASANVLYEMLFISVEMMNDSVVHSDGLFTISREMTIVL